MCVHGFRVVFPSQATIATIVESPLYILGMIPFEANHVPFKKKLFLVHTYLISFTWVYQCYSFAHLKFDIWVLEYPFVIFIPMGSIFTYSP